MPDRHSRLRNPGFWGERHGRAAHGDAHLQVPPEHRLRGTTPEVSGLNIIIAAPVVDEYFNDIDCATSAKVTVQSEGVIKLNLTKTYATITYVNPVIQSIAAGDEWKATVTGKATTGPVVTFYKKISGTWTLTTPTSTTPVDFYVRGA